MFECNIVVSLFVVLFDFVGVSAASYLALQSTINRRLSLYSIRSVLIKKNGRHRISNFTNSVHRMPERACVDVCVIASLQCKVQDFSWTHSV